MEKSFGELLFVLSPLRFFMPSISDNDLLIASLWILLQIQTWVLYTKLRLVFSQISTTEMSFKLVLGIVSAHQNADQSKNG